MNLFAISRVPTRQLSVSNNVRTKQVLLRVFEERVTLIFLFPQYVHLNFVIHRNAKRTLEMFQINASNGSEVWWNLTSNEESRCRDIYLRRGNISNTCTCLKAPFFHSFNGNYSFDADFKYYWNKKEKE